MNLGDRVTTRHGPGRITDIHTDENWTYRRPSPVTYIIVRVDGEPYGRILLPHQVQPLQEEQLTMETAEDKTGGLLIQPPETPEKPTAEETMQIADRLAETTTEEPAPTEPAPDPEPEPDDEEAELTPWP